jgi:outer membrane protein, heavy metal efflux system
MFNKILFGALGGCLLASSASAQVVDATRPPLTLKAAVAEAIDRHPDLRSLRAQVEAAESASTRERYLMPPMLETQIWSWPVTTLNPARTDMYMFMAEQELPGKGKRDARALVVRRDAEIARRQIPVHALELLGEARQAFVDLSLARQVRGLYEGQRGLVREMTEAATLRYAAGEGGQHHSVASLAELTRLERDVIAADERVQRAELRLNAALARPLMQAVELLSPIDASYSRADAERIALDRHPEFRVVDAMVAREEAELARLQGERRPDFVVGGGYMLMPGEAGALTVRAGLTWPNAPWSRGRLTAELDTQTKRIDAAKAQREAVSLRVRRAVGEAGIRMLAAERQVQLLESTVLPQAEHAFELARVAYSGGQGNFLDLLESRRLLFATEVELAEARASVSRAVVDLETVMGIQ